MLERRHHSTRKCDRSCAFNKNGFAACEVGVLRRFPRGNEWSDTRNSTFKRIHIPDQVSKVDREKEKKNYFSTSTHHHIQVTPPRHKHLPPIMKLRWRRTYSVAATSTQIHMVKVHFLWRRSGYKLSSGLHSCAWFGCMPNWYFCFLTPPAHSAHLMKIILHFATAG